MLDRELAPARMDPRAKRTRQLLLDAFSQLLADKTFETITVQDIAERATVNRATFYAHFEDKYVLLDQFMNEMVQQALGKKVPPESEYNASNLRLLIETVCEFLGHLQSHCAPSNRNQFDSLVELQVKQHVYAILLGWLEIPDSRSSARSEQTELRATLTSWAIYGAAKRWSQSKRKETASEFARRALPLIVAGLEAPGTKTAHVSLTS